MASALPSLGALELAYLGRLHHQTPKKRRMPGEARDGEFFETEDATVGRMADRWV